MSEAKDKTIALNVRLKPSESSAHPRATNYTSVGVVQGIAMSILASLRLRCSPPLRGPRRMARSLPRD